MSESLVSVFTIIFCGGFMAALIAHWVRNPEKYGAGGIVATLFFLGVCGVLVFMAASKLNELPTEDKGVVKGKWTAPLVPLSVSVSSNGKLTVSLEGKVITPVGTFSLEWERQRIHYLEVTLGNETKFYPLSERPFELNLPNSLKGISRVTGDGKGNVRIHVPDPGEVKF